MKTLIPIAAFICSIVAMKFYPISKKTESEMEAFIATKRAKEFEGLRFFV